MKHLFYRTIILGLLGSFFWLEIQLAIKGEQTNTDTNLKTYISQDYPQMRESSDFWFNTISQRNNISVQTDTMIDNSSGTLEWENKGSTGTTLHYVFGYKVGSHKILSLQSDVGLSFKIHHYLYKRNLKCNPNNYPKRATGDPHDNLWIDKLRNQWSKKFSEKKLVHNEGFGSNCFLQGEVIPLGENKYSGNTNYQLSLPKIKGLDNTYKIYTFYSINHDLDKNKYLVHWNFL